MSCNQYNCIAFNFTMTAMFIFLIYVCACVRAYAPLEMSSAELLHPPFPRACTLLYDSEEGVWVPYIQANQSRWQRPSLVCPF